MSDTAVPFGVTMYGFKWGAMEVTRLTEIDGAVCISVETDSGRQIEIYASKTGRSLRVFERGKGEWKAVSNADAH